MGREVTSVWRKSSYSDTNGNCVETVSDDGMVLVRDTADRDGGTLLINADAWANFTADLK
jgi:hypothetical protein